MKYGKKKILITTARVLVLTAVILLLLQHHKQAEQKIYFNEFSEESKEGYYEITTIEDFLRFSETVASGNQYEWCEVWLNEDLDFSNVENLMPIGLKGAELFEFKGTFNGNGHTIRNMAIENPGGYVGLFANLGGMVKNLQMEDCYFEGEVCGAITAKSMVNAVVINCYVDAETKGELQGTVAGDFYGYIFNCIITGKNVAGDLHTGWLEQCYVVCDGEYQVADEDRFKEEQSVLTALNGHLSRISGFHDTYDLCLWKLDENISLSKEKAELVESISARVKMDSDELEIKGYYSQNDHLWCIALPAGCNSKPMQMKVKLSSGKVETFLRHPEEPTIVFTHGSDFYGINFITSEIVDSLYVKLSGDRNLQYIHKNKLEENSGMILILDQTGKIHKEVIKGIYGHGNDSWAAQKKSYNLKFEDRVDLLGMGENENFVLLAGYRDDSLMSYVTTTSLINELGFDYAPEFRLVNLYVEGEYAGVYFLAEKIAIDKNRVDISNVYEETKVLNHNYLEASTIVKWKNEGTLAERYFYEIDNQPEDLTGGYLLEIDVEDYTDKESRFVTDRGVKVTMKRAMYSSKEQVNYIADYWQEFEDALYSENGKNSQGKHYSEYVNMDSYVMQWLLYELVQEGSMSSSIYFYKESEVTGDGLLHACFPWDMEHSYLMYGPIQEMWLKESETLSSYWSQFWKHEDFRAAANRIWRTKFVPAIEQMVDENVNVTKSGVKNLRWYEENIGSSSVMETSRWRKMNPYNRCQSIREFLKIRKDALSVLLEE